MLASRIAVRLSIPKCVLNSERPASCVTRSAAYAAVCGAFANVPKDHTPCRDRFFKHSRDVKKVFERGHLFDHTNALGAKTAGE